jgi:hypothetical protein
MKRISANAICAYVSGGLREFSAFLAQRIWKLLFAQSIWKRAKIFPHEKLNARWDLYIRQNNIKVHTLRWTINERRVNERAESLWWRENGEKIIFVARIFSCRVIMALDYSSTKIRTFSIMSGGNRNTQSWALWRSARTSLAGNYKLFFVELYIIILIFFLKAFPITQAKMGYLRVKHHGKNKFLHAHQKYSRNHFCWFLCKRKILKRLRW